MIFIFGSARSGSTWLGKIFDSHPDMLYLHEPDITDRGVDVLPHWFEEEPSQAQIDGAAIYLKRILAIRNSRSVGIRPFFRKSYRGALAENARRSLIYGTKVLERAGLSAIANDLYIPDLALKGVLPRPVVKSVSALGRAEAFVLADSSMTPLLLVRHPCGFVGSMLRGEKEGVMRKVERFGRLAKTRSAIRLGLDREVLAEDDEVAFLSWTWLVSNAEAYATIVRSQGIVLNYDEMANEPSRHIRALFEQLQLGWPEQTEKFLQLSQQSEGDYYSVFRDSREASQRWRSELDDATVRKIHAIVTRDPMGAQFFDS